jgi:hypothetical protein
LPHWTEEPTGQVPAILQREEVVPADPIEAIPAPVWREDETDYTLADEQFAQIIADPDTHLDAPTETLSSEPVAEAPRPLTRAERLRQQDQKLLRHRATRTAPEKDVRKATVV